MPVSMNGYSISNQLVKFSRRALRTVVDFAGIHSNGKQGALRKVRCSLIFRAVADNANALSSITLRRLLLQKFDTVYRSGAPIRTLSRISAATRERQRDKNFCCELDWCPSL